MNMNPKITIVTVCYNTVNSIDMTIKSVINQIYSNIEYIIIDGGSTDGTVDIIKKYSGKIAYWISEPDDGIYDAMNKGIKAATGEWINFMNAGDRFYNDEVISKMFSEVDPTVTIVYGKLMKHIEGYHYEYVVLPLSKMSSEMSVSHQASFIKLSYHKSRLYDATFKSSGDYDFFYHAFFMDKVKFQYIPIIVADFDDRSGMSKTNFKLAKLEDLRVWGEQNNIITRIKVYIWFVYRDIKIFIKTKFPQKTQRELKAFRLKTLGFDVKKD